MKLMKIQYGEPWMTKDERRATKTLVYQLRKFLQQRNVPENPLLALRVNDLAIAYITATRIEQQFQPQPDPPGDTKAPPLANIADTAGKARERMRKALKELEDACAKLGAPIDQGIADTLRPIIKKANTILETSGQAPPSSPQKSVKTSF